MAGTNRTHSRAASSADSSLAESLVATIRTLWTAVEERMSRDRHKEVITQTVNRLKDRIKSSTGSGLQAAIAV